MASVISQFMEHFSGLATHKPGYSPDLSTRRQHRATIRSIIHLLERVRANETHYIENIPDNLQNGTAFMDAEECIAMLNEALDLQKSAF